MDAKLTKKQQYILDKYPDEEFLFADGYDKAIIGIAPEPNGALRVCYDTNKVIKILMRDMNYEDAIEFFDFNIAGAYVGKNTPLFIDKISCI